jgi:hypothetical protein
LTKGRDNHRFELLVEEYKLSREEIFRRLDAQDRLLNYVILLIVGTAASIGALRTVFGFFPWVFILAISISILLLSLTSILNNLWIAMIARYVENELRPNLEEMTGPKVLTWERFLAREKKLPIRLVIASFRPIVYLLTPLSVVIAFLISHRSSAKNYEWVLLVVNILLLFIPSRSGLRALAPGANIK